VNRAVPETWGTSNGIFKTKKVGDVKLSFVEYSASKRVRLHLDIVEYPRGGTPLLYDLIIGKQTLHDLGAVLDLKEKTITIDGVLLPMRNTNNLQLKPSISRALKQNTCLAQEPVSTRNATKHVMVILDAKYDKADLPSIVKNNCAHLSLLHCNLLLALLLNFKELFDGMLRDWKLQPISLELGTGGRCQAVPWQALPHPKDPQDYSHEED
jgi:hypothetical protein